jgi:hypothetical protein
MQSRRLASIKLNRIQSLRSLSSCMTLVTINPPAPYRQRYVSGNCMKKFILLNILFFMYLIPSAAFAHGILWDSLGIWGNVLIPIGIFVLLLGPAYIITRVKRENRETYRALIYGNLILFLVITWSDYPFEYLLFPLGIPMLVLLIFFLREKSEEK